MLWHIMQRYAMFGFTDFVIALGYKGDVIKDYFAHYRQYNNDLRIDLASGNVEIKQSSSEDWTISLIDTGETTMTGGRLLRLSDLLSEPFFLTYGDGLSNINIRELLKAHKASGRTATVTAVSPPPRFGSLRVHDGLVEDFSEKAHISEDRVNGGFFVMEPAVLDEIGGDDCVLESGPLVTLTRKRQLGAFLHNGFWQPMDTLRERDELERLWASGNAPWLTT